MNKKEYSRLKKSINTWIRKSYIYAIKNQDERPLNNFKNCANYILQFFPNKDELKFISRQYFKQFKELYKKKFQRIQNNSEIKKLQEKYPNIDIINAYKFLTLEDKFINSKNDIKIFEGMLDILSKQALKSKKS